MAELTHAVDSELEWGARRDVSHRGQEPSVCYEVLVVGPRGAHVRTLARTPRRKGRTEDADMASTARMMAASRELAGALRPLADLDLDEIRRAFELDDADGVVAWLAEQQAAARAALAKADGEVPRA